MRNWWLAAIVGHQGDAPSNISREGPTGVEGVGGAAGPGPAAGLTATKRGELHYMRVRHADDTPPDGFM